MLPKSLKLLAVVVAAGCGVAVVQAAETIDRIIAVVNDGVVLSSEMERSMKLAEAQLRERNIGTPPPGVLETQVLERLIITRLQTQRAQDAGIRIDDRELNEVLTAVAAQNKLSLPQFIELVKKDGIDYASIREQIRDEVLTQRVRQKEVGSRVMVTDQDVDLALANASADDNIEYRLSHILVSVPDGATAEAREAARAKAATLLKRARDGEDFAQLAIANSDGQQALSGGDLDWRKASNLPTAFAIAAPKLKVGEVADVIESGSGFNIVKLTDLRDSGEKAMVSETKSQHILLMNNQLRDEAATQAQIREIRDRLDKGEDFATLAKKYSDDPGSKNSGGDLSWQPPGVFAPEFQAALDALEPGQTSQPFRTQFGWHIARVLDRRTRDATIEARRGRARQAIQARKEAEEYEAWIRRLREEAYVEYRMAPTDRAAKPAG
ncbi:MAG: peptidylprolyl isomerase [Gammaproteobacteria bacterium]|jgi:peptidyl-prolyl cis-trans isomerase SurA|uniref:peptidylprolyl isomerase n=1 Tax=Nevskia sp. TaxID=1929292 RepID=UPI0040356AE3|nr:peptidylprolyl isomerase [Gammaproteobacteria bacterium]